MTSDGELVPLLIAAQGSTLGSNTLALDVEKNPTNADLGITCHVEPFEVVYVEVSEI